MYMYRICISCGEGEEEGGGNMQVGGRREIGMCRGRVRGVLLL